jgi:transcriptional regulator with XRE-family HTH domain
MKPQLRKDIGMRMRKIRKTLGYTQVKMVSYFEIGRANYSRIEKGEIFPSPTILHTLCKKFHVSLDWLIANEGHMFIFEKQKQDAMKTLKSGKFGEEVNDLLFHIEKVPMVRHAMMGYFLEYKQKNLEIIREILEKIVPLPGADRVNHDNE